ncbi:hypothetical protein [Microbulbifer aggregans]|nr:hypothetical protein [Microbulbifer aggregans]
MKRIIIPLLLALVLLALAGTIQQCTKGEREVSPATEESGQAP